MLTLDKIFQASVVLKDIVRSTPIIKKLHISLVAPITRVTEALAKVHIISVLILLK